MKKLLYTAAAALSLIGASAPGARAQIIITNPLVCGIYFDYDASGNRIKRYYDCKDPYSADPGGPTGPTGPISTRRRGTQGTVTMTRNAGVSKDGAQVEVQVAPNPTTGAFTITIPEAIKTHFHLYDDKGKIISSGQIEGTQYHGNITALASGSYMVVVYFKDKAYSFKLIRL
jgi:hypothetical protein